MRRLAGLLLTLGGIAVLAVAGWQYGQGWMARDQARAAWAQVEARRARLAANERVGPTVTGPVPAGTPVARLVIPRIGLDEVIVEGVGDGELNSSPGHLPGTPLPGLTGNSVISAHRDLHFRRLGRLQIGDTLSTVTERHTVTWRVSDRRIVGANDAALFQSPGRELTLTTCWPIRLIGPAPDRLLLTAIPVDSVPHQGAPAVAAGRG